MGQKPSTSLNHALLSRTTKEHAANSPGGVHTYSLVTNPCRVSTTASHELQEHHGMILETSGSKACERRNLGRRDKRGHKSLAASKLRRQGLNKEASK